MSSGKGCKKVDEFTSHGNVLVRIFYVKMWQIHQYRFYSTGQESEQDIRLMKEQARQRCAEHDQQLWASLDLDPAGHPPGES